MLSALLETLREASGTDQVKFLLPHLSKEPQSALSIMKKLGLSHRPTLRKNYLQSALDAGPIKHTLPEKPNSRLQKYRLRRKA